MVPVSIVYHLTDCYVVDFDGTLYILLPQDVLITGNNAYTYPDKLRTRYR